MVEYYRGMKSQSEFKKYLIQLVFNHIIYLVPLGMALFPYLGMLNKTGLPAMCLLVG